MSSASVPGFICAFRFGPDGQGNALAESELDPADRSGSEWIWLHVNLADWRCRRWLGDTFRLPRDLVSEFADAPVRQHVSAWQDVLFGHLGDFRRDFDGDLTEFAWMHFILSGSYLITGRVRAIQSAERTRSLVAAGFGFERPDELLSRMLSFYTDTLDAALHRLTDELELIEDQVLDERHRGERKRLMLTRRETAQLHRHMRAMRRALQTAERASIPTPQGFAITVQRLVNLDQDFVDMEARARFFHDEIDAKLASETNRQLYTLSALTAAFLPPALVAGLFGMNLEGMPFTGAAWGFWGAAGLSALSSGAVILYLRLTDRS